MLVLWLILAVMLVMGGLVAPILSFIGLLIFFCLMVYWIGVFGLVLFVLLILVANFWLNSYCKSKGL